MNGRRSLVLVAALAAGFLVAAVVAGCGGGGTTTVTVTAADPEEGGTETSSEPSTAGPEEEVDGDQPDELEASALEASEEFLEATIDRDGEKVCEMSSPEKISALILIMGKAGSSCSDAMDDLLAKIPESKIEHDEELLEALPGAEVEVVGDKASIYFEGIELEFVLADGNWLLYDSNDG